MRSRYRTFLWPDRNKKTFKMRPYFTAICTLLTLYVSDACDPGWSPYANSCFRYFSERKNWHDAKAYCESQKSHLAIIMDHAENDFAKALLRKQHIGGTDQVWMDGDDLKVENMFVWENTGQGFEITDWGPNEPNQNGGNEDCLSFFARYDFKWNDEHCDKPFGFLCEKDLPDPSIG